MRCRAFNWLGVKDSVRWGGVVGEVRLVSMGLVECGMGERL